MTSNYLSSTTSTDIFNLAVNFVECSKSKNTKATYRYAWNSFMAWCQTQQQDPLTAKSKESLVAFYISDMAGRGELKLASINCYLIGIKVSYREQGITLNMADEGLRAVIRGIKRTVDSSQRRMEPILVEDLAAMVNAIPIERKGKPYLSGIRDRALLLIGFCGAFRRSELVSLTVEDLKFSRDGFIVTLRRSKTDQEGKGHEKIIPYGSNPITCPVRALNDWMTTAKITSGPLFVAVGKNDVLSKKPLCALMVYKIIRRNPHIKDNKEKFGGHSLRSGFVTSAAKRKVPEDLIMKQTGHKSSDILKIYIRRGTSFTETAAAMVGL